MACSVPPVVHHAGDNRPVTENCEHRNPQSKVMTQDRELIRLRQRMDELNHRLVNVLHERAHLSFLIGSHKHANGLKIIDPAREQSMQQTLMRELPTQGFSATALETILQAVFAASRDIVAKPYDTPLPPS